MENSRTGGRGRLTSISFRLRPRDSGGSPDFLRSPQSQGGGPRRGEGAREAARTCVGVGDGHRLGVVRGGMHALPVWARHQPTMASLASCTRFLLGKACGRINWH